jgi:N-acyl homoserine lactone hydrolase
MNDTPRRRRRLVIAALSLAALVGVTTSAALVGRASTSHPVAPASLGVARTSASLEDVVDVPGPVTVETVVGADWEVNRSGLINLDNPTAKAAHLVDGPEPIEIMFHAIRHPTRGLFLVDTGVEHAFVTDPAHAVVRGMIGSFAHLDKLRVRTDTASWLAQQPAAPEGVLLTHLHLDHVMGLRDVPSSVPVYVGPGEAEERSAMNFLAAGIFNEALEGKGAVRELHFTPDPAAQAGSAGASTAFAGVTDLFGDGSVWAIWVPGHTPGSVAYLARTPSGPVLLTGDACHTAWGWEHGVEPGSFSADRAQGAESLAKLRALVARHPEIDVRLGHQELVRTPQAAR